MNFEVFYWVPKLDPSFHNRSVSSSIGNLEIHVYLTQAQTQETAHSIMTLQFTAMLALNAYIGHKKTNSATS